MICRECRGRTCLACDMEWHPEVTCADNIARRAQEKTEEEAAAGAYIDANAKLCPNCQVRGEKISGCDHMTCKLPSLQGNYQQLIRSSIRSTVPPSVLLGMLGGLQRGSTSWQYRSWG